MTSLGNAFKRRAAASGKARSHLTATNNAVVENERHLCLKHKHKLDIKTCRRLVTFLFKCAVYKYTYLLTYLLTYLKSLDSFQHK